MNLCPQCGGILDKKIRAGTFVDEMTYDIEGNLLQGCLCFYRVPALVRAIEGFEQAFEDLLGEHFEGMSRDQIIADVLKMEKGTPLRVRVQRGFTVLKRARERMSELKRKEEREEEVNEKLKEDAKSRGARGNSLTVRDWMRIGGG